MIYDTKILIFKYENSEDEINKSEFWRIFTIIIVDLEHIDCGLILFDK